MLIWQLGSLDDKLEEGNSSIFIIVLYLLIFQHDFHRESQTKTVQEITDVLASM